MHQLLQLAAAFFFVMAVTLQLAGIPAYNDHTSLILGTGFFLNLIIGALAFRTLWRN